MKISNENEAIDIIHRMYTASALNKTAVIEVMRKKRTFFYTEIATAKCWHDALKRKTVEYEGTYEFLILSLFCLSRYLMRKKSARRA